MKILIVGDPHGNLDKLKKIPKKGLNLIIITGDLGKADLARKRFFENIERKKNGLEEIEENAKHLKDVYMELHNSTLNVLKYLSKFAPVYTIQGNVGISTITDTRKKNEKYGIKLPSTREKIKKMSNVFLVKNRLRIIDNLRVGFLEWFTDVCWVKEFNPPDYKEIYGKAKKQTDKARRVLKKFNDLDILICHQPPYGYLDKVGTPAPMHWRGKHAGSKVILDYIMKRAPPYVFCGHIHEGKGKVKIGRSKVYNLGAGGWKIIKI